MEKMGKDVSRCSGRGAVNEKGVTAGDELLVKMNLREMLKELGDTSPARRDAAQGVHEHLRQPCCEGPWLENSWGTPE